MTIQLLDIYQGNKYNPVSEKNTGTHGVLIKGGQGEYQDYDAHQCTYIADTEAAGLPWGIFWQMDARYSPEKHKAAIKMFYDNHGFGKLKFWMACEKPFYPLPDFLYGKMPFAYYKPIESVWRGIAAYTGTYPGIYCSPSMWKLIFGRIPDPLAQEIADKSPLWLAHHKAITPEMFGKWLKWTWWQYQGEPDYSVFNGTDEEFKAMFGLNETIPLPPPVEPPALPIPTKKPVVTMTYDPQAVDVILMEKQ